MVDYTLLVWLLVVSSSCAELMNSY